MYNNVIYFLSAIKRTKLYINFKYKEKLSLWLYAYLSRDNKRGECEAADRQ